MRWRNSRTRNILLLLGLASASISRNMTNIEFLDISYVLPEESIIFNGLNKSRAYDPSTTAVIESYGLDEDTAENQDERRNN